MIHLDTRKKYVETVYLHHDAGAKGSRFPNGGTKIPKKSRPAPSSYRSNAEKVKGSAPPKGGPSCFPEAQAEHLNLPVSLFSWSAKAGHHKGLLKPFLRFKAARWNRVKKKDFPGLCRRMLEAGFAHSENNDFIFLHDLAAWRGKKVVVMSSDIERLEGTTLCFAVMQENMLLLHNKGTREDVGPSRKGGRQEKRCLSPSAHNGGISLSLMAEVFGRTQSWASRMRSKVKLAGLATYKRRAVVYEPGSTAWTECSVGRVTGDGQWCWKGIDGKYRREVTSLCTAKFFEFKRASKGIRRVRMKNGATIFIEGPERVLRKPRFRNSNMECRS